MKTKKISSEDSYLHLKSLRKGKNKNELEFSCITSACRIHKFVVENWELGYDFIKKFEATFKKRGYDMDKDKLLNTYIHLAQKIEKWKKRKAKNNPNVRPTPSTLCNICKHRINYNTCKAFPNGIPVDLYNKPHLEIHPKQENDIVFKLGKAGSKNAGIKPLKNYSIIMVRPSSLYIIECDNIIKELTEEKWYKEKEA